MRNIIALTGNFISLRRGALFYGKQGVAVKFAEISQFQRAPVRNPELDTTSSLSKCDRNNCGNKYDLTLFCPLPRIAENANVTLV